MRDEKVRQHPGTRHDGGRRGDCGRCLRIRARLHGLMLMCRVVFLVMSFMRVRGSRLITAAVRFTRMAMRPGGDLRAAMTLAEVAARQPKHLSPSQREQRKGGEQGGRTAEHGAECGRRVLDSSMRVLFRYRIRLSNAARPLVSGSVCVAVTS